MEQLPQDNQDLKNKILQKIESESLCPKSRWFFNCREGLVWLFWGLVIVVSALSVAVTTSALKYGNYAFYEATHPSFFAFALEILPYIWLIIFAVMVILAIYNIRHTKKGYRYALWKIIGGTLLLSVVTGGLFHFLGLGFVLDKELGKMSSSYTSQEKFELRFWQNPKAGRLVVELEEINTENPLTEIMTLEDIRGGVWEVNVSSLSLEDLNLLNHGKQVRLIGQPTQDGEVNFHACAAFPWVFEHEYSRHELRELYESTRNKLTNFKNRSRGPGRQVATSTSDLCEGLRIIKKFAPQS